MIKYIYFVLILMHYRNDVKNIIKNKFLILRDCCDIIIVFIFLKIILLKKNSLIVIIIIRYLNILILRKRINFLFENIIETNF